MVIHLGNKWKYLEPFYQLSVNQTCFFKNAFIRTHAQTELGPDHEHRAIYRHSHLSGVVGSPSNDQCQTYEKTATNYLNIDMTAQIGMDSRY